MNRGLRIVSRVHLIVILLVLMNFDAGAVVLEAPIESPLPGPGAGDRAVVAFLDGDCSLDVVASRDQTIAAEDPSLTLSHGDRTGLFPDGASLDGGQRISGIAVGDLDGDGVLDLVTSEKFDRQGVLTPLCQSTGPQVPVFLGDGLGGYVFQGCLEARDRPSAVLLGDFFEDGILDVLVTNSPPEGGSATSSDVVLFQGLGDGTFLPGTVVFERQAMDVAAADLDRDGHLDLVVGGPYSTYVAYGAGDGTFAYDPIGLTGKSYRVAPGDIDGDGWTDYAGVGSVAGNVGDDVVWVALNDGAGGIGNVTSYVVGTHPVGVAVADLDRDGFAEVVVANHESDDVSVFSGSPSGALGAEQRFPAGRNPQALVIADADADGDPDVVVTNRNVAEDGTVDDGSISFLAQRTTAPLAVVTSTLPDGRVGAPYHVCLAARGGTPPYEWSQSAGTLPPGLTLDGVDGSIAGSPTADGAYDFTMDVTDSVPDVDSAPLSITVGGPIASPPSAASDRSLLQTPMLVTAYDPALDMVSISYDPACDATDHAVHAGPLAAVSTHGYDRTNCGLGTSGAAQFEAGAGSRFWVLVGRNADFEGSAGTDSAGVERPWPPAVTGCFVPRELGATCP